MPAADREAAKQKAEEEAAKKAAAEEAAKKAAAEAEAAERQRTEQAMHQAERQANRPEPPRRPAPLLTARQRGVDPPPPPGSPPPNAFRLQASPTVEASKASSAPVAPPLDDSQALQEQSKGRARDAPETGFAVSAQDAERLQKLREVFARFVSRRDILVSRVKDARDRLAGLQRAVEEARSRVETSSAASSQIAGLEAAICAAAQRVSVLRAALEDDEATLAGKVSEQAARVRILREDVSVAKASLAAAEAEVEAASAAEGSGHQGPRMAEDVESLRAALESAKAEQQRALEAAAEEHETLVARSLADRGAKLQATAARGEAEVASLSREEAMLRREAAQLEESVRVKKAEAEAAAQRHRGLVREVEQLKAALAQAEAADGARLEALQQEVAEAAAEAAALAPDAAGNGTASLRSSALSEAERRAREAEELKWQEEVESIRDAAHWEVEEARKAGQRQYQELVSRVEQRYRSEFEAAEASIKQQREADAKALDDLTKRLREVEAATEAARAERESLLRRAGSARKSAKDRVEQRLARLNSLRVALKTAWERSGAAPDEIVGFLRQVQDILPYTPEVHEAYEIKLRQMRFATPLLQALTRREVMDYRIQRMRRQAEVLIERHEVDRSATVELEALRKKYQETLREQEAVTAELAREAEAFRAEFGTDFVYRGKPIQADDL